MKRNAAKVFTMLFAVLFLSLTVLQMNAHARAGGGRSMGGRMGGYSRQTSPAPYQSTTRPQYGQSPYQQRGGGFMSGLAGGVAGGMLGSMLFSGNAQAGGQGNGGGGIGLFEIIILAGGGYFIYRAMSRRRG